MKQFSMELNGAFQRPVIFMKDWYGLSAMIDTGALFPVWVTAEKVLLELGGELQDDNVAFGGFGGVAKGKLYRLPMLKVGQLVFPNIPIVYCEMEMPIDLILSATMFSCLRYEIDDVSHILNIAIPDGQSCVRNLRIQDSNGNYRVLCTSD